MGLGVVKYCTPQGGSGFIANPSLPWLSSFNITQQAPVYDQETAWLRNSPPGSYTNYSRFGPPYSVDGGVLPPYFDPPIAAGTDSSGNPVDANGQPIPVPTSCGMGAILDGANGPSLILLRSDVVAPMPSITTTARTGCQQSLADTCPSAVASWVQSNPWITLALAVGLGAILFGDKK
jgi:hypothetical protein